MTRRERHEQVSRLKVAGLTFREIAEHLGLAKSTVTDAYYDPTGDKARVRKQRRTQPCIDCGKQHGNSGSEPGDRCRNCRREFEKSDLEHRRRAQSRTLGRVQWTNDAILDALRSVAVGTVINGGDYRRAYAKYPGRLPSVPLVIRRFGKWAHAVEAAGLTMNCRPHRERIDRTPDEGMILAVQDCAAALGREPTYRDYEDWARLGGAPSAVGVRNRFGSSWMNVCDVAFGREAVAA